jgi:hypothetical protein
MQADHWQANSASLIMPRLHERFGLVPNMLLLQGCTCGVLPNGRLTWIACWIGQVVAGRALSVACLQHMPG